MCVRMYDEILAGMVDLLYAPPSMLLLSLHTIPDLRMSSNLETYSMATARSVSQLSMTLICKGEPGGKKAYSDKQYYSLLAIDTNTAIVNP